MNPYEVVPSYNQKPAEDHEQYKSGVSQDDKIGEHWVR
jgi:hypothetical protein